VRRIRPASRRFFSLRNCPNSACSRYAISTAILQPEGPDVNGEFNFPLTGVNADIRNPHSLRKCLNSVRSRYSISTAILRPEGPPVNGES